MNISELLSEDNPAFLTQRKSNEYIADMLGQSRASLVGRFGSIEARVIGYYLLGVTHKHDKVLSLVAQRNAGICQPTDRNLKHFACDYLSAASHVDLLGAWDFPTQCKLVELTEPSHVARLSFIDPVNAFSKGIAPWTRGLKGKRVLIVHPFAKSIMSQYSNRANIPMLAEMLPDFELEVVRPPVTTGTDIEYEKTWREYLSELKREILRRDFDVAIIGAGSYGLPIGSFVKTLGKTAIHLGGVTQLMFGIMGKRWEDVKYVQKLDQTGWVRPSDDETPEYATTIEGGCYW